MLHDKCVLYMKSNGLMDYGVNKTIVFKSFNTSMFHLNCLLFICFDTDLLKLKQR